MIPRNTRKTSAGSDSAADRWLSNLATSTKTPAPTFRSKMPGLKEITDEKHCCSGTSHLHKDVDLMLSCNLQFYRFFTGVPSFYVASSQLFHPLDPEFSSRVSKTCILPAQSLQKSTEGCFSISSYAAIPPRAADKGHGHRN